MTKDQIAFLKGVFAKQKEDGTALSTSTTYICNDHNISNNTQDLCILDDSHELLHIVKINMDPHSQPIAPVEVTSCGYDVLFFIKSIYTPKDFETVVDTQFTFLSEEQKKKMKEFAYNIPVVGNKLDRAIPYYGKKDIKIAQNLNKLDRNTNKELDDYKE